MLKAEQKQIPVAVLIRDYCTPFSLDEFPNATTMLSLSFELSKLQQKVFKKLPSQLL